MWWPSIAKCYNEIVRDPSFLGIFLEECTSPLELHVMGAIQFRIILKKFFTHVAPPGIWGKTGVGFVTDTDPRVSGEATPTTILITNGVTEGYLGMVTTSCYHVHIKMEAPDVLAAFHQHDSPEPSIAVVRWYTNTPYILHGTSRLLYLDMSTLSGGVSSAQFPLDCLHLWKLFPYSKTEVLLPHEEGEIGYKAYPFTGEVLWRFSKVVHYLFNPLSLLIPSSDLLPHLEEGIQMEEEPGYDPALRQLQDYNQARAQLNCELSEEVQMLAHRYEDQ